MLSLARSLSARLRPIGLLIVLAVVAWQPSPATAADAAERIDALLAKYQEFGLFTGAALVADQGRVVLKKGYGLGETPRQFLIYTDAIRQLSSTDPQAAK